MSGVHRNRADKLSALPFSEETVDAPNLYITFTFYF